MEQILAFLGYFLVSLGAIFLFLGALGLFRMPDFYTRIQAGTKSSTLGAMSFIFGIGLIETDWFLKTLVIVIFIAISNPISSHALARGAYKSKHKPFLPDGQDAYKNIENDEDKEVGA